MGLYGPYDFDEDGDVYYFDNDGVKHKEQDRPKYESVPNNYCPNCKRHWTGDEQ